MPYLAILLALVISGVQEQEEIKIPAPDGWAGETIPLPPTFAPDMKLKGVEQLKFAPGMFDAESDSYFSYVFVLRVEKSPELTDEFLKEELKRYYDGLASSVAKGKGLSVDDDHSVVELSKPDDSKDESGVRRINGEIKWMEMFVSEEMQKLHLEITIKPADNDLIDVFVCASPKDKDEPIWKTLRKTRDDFFSQ